LEVAYKIFHFPFWPLHDNVLCINGGIIWWNLLIYDYFSASFRTFNKPPTMYEK